MNIYGYFDKPDQAEPVFDPGLGVTCPFCSGLLAVPVVTISLMVPNDNRSYFYRAHRFCYYDSAPEAVDKIESALIDAIYQSGMSN